jgi:Dolichyl-phosphate-mannose-protein mannosyltransferase
MSASPAPRDDMLPIAALMVLGSLAFVRLMSLPAFEDEGSQLRWIFRLLQAGEWLPPLGEGKPFEAWPMAPLVRWGIPALAAARALHVLAGMIGAALTYRLARQLGGRSTALASGVLFAVCPFVVYLQRLALSDMFLCTAGIWVLSSVLALIRLPTHSQAARLAAALVLAAFCKFPVGFVFVGALPLALLLMPSGERHHLLQRRASLLAYAHSPVILLALAVAVLATIRSLHGQAAGFGLTDFAGIALGRYDDIAAIIGVPKSRFPDELVAQLSWPVIVIALIGIVAAARFGDWRHRWMIAVAMIPMLGIVLLARFWFSRYLLFTLPPLIVSGVLGWHQLARRTQRVGRPMEWAALAVCVGFMVRQSALLVLAPAAANWSALDRFQYLEGWPSGYGYPEAAQFLLEAPNAPPLIFSLDGHGAYQLLSYLPAQWSSRVRPVFYGDDGRVMEGKEARLANLLEHAPVWIVVSDRLLQEYLDSDFGRRDPAPFSVRPIAQFDKPGSHSRLVIYEVTRR